MSEREVKQLHEIIKKSKLTPRAIRVLNYMTKSKFIFDKLTKVIEQGIISYKDLNSEIMNILKTKRDEIVFKMKLTSKEETDILNKRLENLEKKVQILEKLNKKKFKRAKRS